MAWDPTQYLHFAGERLRPALDLLQRIDVEAPQRVVDLGAGAGNVTRLLAARWPEAHVTGVDSSPEMLARAAADLPDLEWIEADLARWRPPHPVDVLYSNAAMHWIDDHERLFPALLEHVAPGGVLAVQMPRNHAAPSHTAIAETVRAGPWRARLEPLLRTAPVRDPAFYYDLLAPRAERVELWETEYVHVLTGPDPVKEWTKGTALRPLLTALDDDAERNAFESAYATRLAHAYPRRADGRTLFPFRRLFLVAAALR